VSSRHSHNERIHGKSPEKEMRLMPHSADAAAMCHVPIYKISPPGMKGLGEKVERYCWWYCWYEDLRLRALLGSATAIKA